MFAGRMSLRYVLLSAVLACTGYGQIAITLSGTVYQDNNDNSVFDSGDGGFGKHDGAVENTVQEI